VGIEGVGAWGLEGAGVCALSVWRSVLVPTRVANFNPSSGVIFLRIGF